MLSRSKCKDVNLRGNQWKLYTSKSAIKDEFCRLALWPWEHGVPEEMVKNWSRNSRVFFDVVSNSLWCHGLQHARLPCPSLSPGVSLNTYLLSGWCYSTISSSVTAFSSCLQYFPASGSLQMSHLFESGAQSFNFNISPSNEYSGQISFRIDWFDLLADQGTLKSLLQHHSLKASILRSAFFIVQLSHPHMTTGKTIALTRRTFVGNVSAF